MSQTECFEISAGDILMCNYHY